MGVPVNLKRAFRLFECAAKQGRVEAQYEVGVAHLEGKGLRKSDAQALNGFAPAPSKATLNVSAG
jgi:TPR repeat protein